MYEIDLFKVKNHRFLGYLCTNNLIAAIIIKSRQQYRDHAAVNIYLIHKLKFSMCPLWATVRSIITQAFLPLYITIISITEAKCSL